MLFGRSRVREVPNELARKLVNFGALEIEKFLTSETENCPGICGTNNPATAAKIMAADRC
jgi:hypothetical protein